MEKKKFQQSVTEKRCRQLRNRASMSESEHKTKKKTDSIITVNLPLICLMAERRICLAPPETRPAGAAEVERRASSLAFPRCSCVDVVTLAGDV